MSILYLLIWDTCYYHKLDEMSVEYLLDLKSRLKFDGLNDTKINTFKQRQFTKVTKKLQTELAKDSQYCISALETLQKGIFL